MNYSAGDFVKYKRGRFAGKYCYFILDKYYASSSFADNEVLNICYIREATLNGEKYHECMLTAKFGVYAVFLHEDDHNIYTTIQIP